MTFFYFFSILLFFNYSSPFIFWVMTELNLIVFILLIFGMDMGKYKQEMQDLVMFYFIVQSVASILILSDFFFSSEFYIFNSDSMFICSLLIKLGVFPFFFWVYKVSHFFSSKIMSFLLTLQKIPFFFALFNSFNTFITFILLFSFLAGCLLIFYSMDLMFMIISSSLFSSYWVYYLYSYSSLFLILYFFLYGTFIFSFLYYTSCNSISVFSSIFSLLLFNFLLGLSPLSLFFFKLYTMFFLFFNYKILEVVLFCLLSFMCLFGYMKFIYKSFFFKFEVYSTSNFFSFKLFFFFSSIMLFFMFLMY